MLGSKASFPGPQNVWVWDYVSLVWNCMVGLGFHLRNPEGFGKPTPWRSRNHKAKKDTSSREQDSRNRNHPGPSPSTTDTYRETHSIPEPAAGSDFPMQHLPDPSCPKSYIAPLGMPFHEVFPVNHSSLYQCTEPAHRSAVEIQLVGPAFPRTMSALLPTNPMAPGTPKKNIKRLSYLKRHDITLRGKKKKNIKRCELYKEQCLPKTSGKMGVVILTAMKSSTWEVAHGNAATRILHCLSFVFPARHAIYLMVSSCRRSAPTLTKQTCFCLKCTHWCLASVRR